MSGAKGGMTAEGFVEKWGRAELSERAASQEHFIDLYRLIGVETPAGADGTGRRICLRSAGVSRIGAGEGHFRPPPCHRYHPQEEGHRMPKPVLTIPILGIEATAFAAAESVHPEPSLFGVTDGKAVGTYLELKFRAHLEHTYSFKVGNAASGIDFPDLDVDMKVTSVTQPQSSCPFKSARQKIFGLGYHLLVFVYEKSDNPVTQTATLSIVHTIFVDRSRTADYTMTYTLRQMLDAHANAEDLIGLMRDRNLPVDDVEASNIANDLLRSPPEQGYLTVSNALQWRLQYGRAITEAGAVEGILRLR